MVAVRHFCGRLIGLNETFANANLKLILRYPGLANKILSSFHFETEKGR